MTRSSNENITRRPQRGSWPGRRLFWFLLRLLTIVGVITIVLIAGAMAYGMRQPPRVLAYVDFNLETPLQDMVLLDFNHNLRVREPLQVDVGDMDWTQKRLVVMSYNSSGLWQTFDPSTGASLLETRPADEFGWLLSPDERYLAYSTIASNGSLSQFQILDTQDGSSDRMADVSTAYHQPLLWSPDSRVLLFQRRTANGMNILYLFRPETNRRTLVSSVASDPAFSPDGQQIIYTTYVGEASSPRLEIYDISTGERRGLLPNDQFDQRTPAWSPDGQWIAMAYDDALGVVRVDGTDLQVLTSPFFVSNPVWSPDGRSLVFIAGAGITSMYKVADVQSAVDQVRQAGQPLDPLSLTLDRQVYGVYPVWQPVG